MARLYVNADVELHGGGVTKHLWLDRDRLSVWLTESQGYGAVTITGTPQEFGAFIDALTDRVLAACAERRNAVDRCRYAADPAKYPAHVCVDNSGAVLVEGSAKLCMYETARQLDELSQVRAQVEGDAT